MEEFDPILDSADMCRSRTVGETALVMQKKCSSEFRGRVHAEYPQQTDQEEGDHLFAFLQMVGLQKNLGNTTVAFQNPMISEVSTGLVHHCWVHRTSLPRLRWLRCSLVQATSSAPLPAPCCMHTCLPCISVKSCVQFTMMY